MNVVGNVYDKYGTRNPIARALMRGFLDNVTALYRNCDAKTVLEVGAGEGRLAQQLLQSGPPPQRFEITDVDVGVLEPDLDPRISVRQASIYALPYPDNAFELVICCEVLEHLEDPKMGLSELARVARDRVLLSTPWEPVWRMLNLARGKYIRHLGNTPGHLQHFSRRALQRLVKPHLHILEQRTPLPWTILLTEPIR